MLRWMYPSFATGRVAVALLIVRVVFGVAMAVHGWSKIQDPLDWMGDRPGAAPAPLQLLAAIAEFFGGIGLAVGLLTPLCALGILATMTVAIHRHLGKGDPWVMPGKPSWELASLYLTIAAAMLLAGPGRLSLDHLLLGKRRG